MHNENSGLHEDVDRRVRPVVTGMHTMFTLPTGGILHDLDPREMSFVAHRWRPLHCAAGSTILLQGEVNNRLFILVKGLFDIYIDYPGGERKHVARLLPGECAGEMSLLSGLPASASVSAPVDTELMSLEQQDFVEIMSSCPTFARNLGRILSRRVARTNEGRAQRFGRVMRLRVHPDTPIGLAEAIAESAAKHLQTMLLVLDWRADGRNWRPDRMLGELHSLEASGVLARLSQTHEHGAYASHANDASGETCARAEAWLSDYVREVLVVTDIDLDKGDAVSLLSAPVQRDVVLWPDGLQGVRDAIADVALITPDRRPNTRRSLEEATARTGARVVRILAPGKGDVADHIGWLGRHLAGLKVGLALGAGGSLGFAHIGVIGALRARSIPIDVVTGCSIGAVVASGLSLGQDTDTMATQLAAAMKNAVRLTVPRHAFLSDRGIRQNLKKLLGETQIEDLTIPTAYVAVDLLQRREVVMERGLARKAVRASISIPGIFPPVWEGEHCLVDGGVVDPVPSTVARSLGADIVIAIRLVGMPNSQRVSAVMSETESHRRSPLVFDTIQRTFDVISTEIGSHAGEAGDVNVIVQCEPLGMRDVEKARRLIPVGEAALYHAWSQIESTLPWTRGSHPRTAE
jgi:NTE family protein